MLVSDDTSIHDMNNFFFERFIKDPTHTSKTLAKRGATEVTVPQDYRTNQTISSFYRTHSYYKSTRTQEIEYRSTPEAS